MRRTLALSVLLLAACRTPSMPAPQQLSVPAAAAAPAKVAPAADRLRALSDRYWTALLETTSLPLMGEGQFGGPLFATALGDHRFDGKLDDLSPDALARVHQALELLRKELDSVAPGELQGEDAITLQMLRAQLDDAKASEACAGEVWLVDQMNGPQVQLPQTWLYYPLGTAKGAAELAARYGQAGRMFDQLIASLRRGLLQSRVSPKLNIQKVLAQLGALLAKDAEHSDLLPPEDKFAGLPQAQRSTARETVRKAIAESVLPGLARYRDFLRDELLPRARADVGVWALPGGDACYAFEARYQTGTARTPQELHELGLAELARIEGEQEQIARSLGAKVDQGHVDLKAFRAQLDKNKDSFKRTGDELLAWNKATLARAMAALPRVFNHLPTRPIETRPFEAYRAASAVPGYYQPAPDDGSQPAIYLVNTYKPETRPLYNEEALCFHETVPGHHLQGTIQQDLKALPDFRRQTGETAYIEGWALYSERMADETMHLYSGPAARFGMLGYQAWRASRLVVDTGMHALHWDREKALQFMRDHTTLPDDEAANEIDRYIIMPGQALGYMVGELELFRLRALAKERLGDRFDLKAFHDVVLQHGAVPMSVLGRLVEDFAK